MKSVHVSQRKAQREKCPVYTDYGGEKKMLVGRCFKSKATQCVGFGTTTQNLYVKDTT